MYANQLSHIPAALRRLAHRVRFAVSYPVVDVPAKVHPRAEEVDPHPPISGTVALVVIGAALIAVACVGVAYLHTMPIG